MEQVETVVPQLAPDRLQLLLSAPERRVRRAAYRAAIAAGRLETDRLLLAAVKDDDHPIRTLCARAVVQRTRDRQQLRRLLDSRTALVRAEAVHALSEVGVVQAAVKVLADPHRLVRATAQAVVRRDGADPAEQYRRLAVREEPPPGALAGLGETGEPGDRVRSRRGGSASWF